MNELEQRYRELEQSRQEPAAARARRGQVGLQLALILVVLLTGSTAAVDLRRLQTPLGAAQSWAEAVVFGDCGRAAELSVPPVRGEPGPAGADERDRLCAAVRQRQARGRAVSRTTVRTRLLQQGRTRAEAEATVRRPDGQVTTTVGLRRAGDGWRVVRDEQACRVGC